MASCRCSLCTGLVAAGKAANVQKSARPPHKEPQVSVRRSDGVIFKRNWLTVGFESKNHKAQVPAFRLG